MKLNRTNNYIDTSRYKYKLHNNVNNDKIIVSHIDNNFKSTEPSNYPTTNNYYSYVEQLYNTPRELCMLTQGSEQGIDIILRSLNVGNIIYTTPTFGMVYVYSHLNNIQITQVDYRYTGCGFETNITKQTEKKHVAYVAVTDNLTGYETCVHDIKILADRCKYVIVDCAYKTIDEVKHYIELTNTFNNIFVLHTMSKYYAGAGMRAGVIFTSQNNIERIKQYRPMYEISNHGGDYFKFVHENANHFNDCFDRITESSMWMSSVGDILNTCSFFNTYRLTNSIKKYIKSKEILCRYFTVSGVDFVRITTPDLNDNINGLQA